MFGREDELQDKLDQIVKENAERRLDTIHSFCIKCLSKRGKFIIGKDNVSWGINDPETDGIVNFINGSPTIEDWESIIDDILSLAEDSLKRDLF